MPYFRLRQLILCGLRNPVKWIASFNSFARTGRWYHIISSFGHFPAPTHPRVVPLRGRYSFASSTTTPTFSFSPYFFSTSSPWN